VVLILASAADSRTDDMNFLYLFIASIVGFFLGCMAALYLTFPGLSDLTVYFLSVIVSVRPVDNVDWYWSLDEYQRYCAVTCYVTSAMLIAMVLNKILRRVAFLPKNFVEYFVFWFFGLIIGFGFMKNTFVIG
jgi:hypothetical protein